MAKILITGASGLVGTALSKLLYSKHTVSSLSRFCKPGNSDCISWNYKEQQINKNALKDVDVLVHLAGAGVMDKAWTKAYRQEIIESRVASLQFLYRCFESNNHFPKVLVCAGGIGYYGLHSEQSSITEEHAAGTDFLSQVCVAWENAAMAFEKKNCRVVVVRTGLVLSNKGGALQPLLKLNNFHFSTVTGSGQQIFPWIHIDDLCAFYQMAIENENLRGAYNLVAPQQITAKEFDLALISQTRKKAYFPGASAFVLNLLMGDRASALLFGLPISAAKVMAIGFTFKYNTIKLALKNLCE